MGSLGKEVQETPGYYSLLSPFYSSSLLLLASSFWGGSGEERACDHYGSCVCDATHPDTGMLSVKLEYRVFVGSNLGFLKIWYQYWDSEKQLILLAT